MFFDRFGKSVPSSSVAPLTLSQPKDAVVHSGRTSSSSPSSSSHRRKVDDDAIAVRRRRAVALGLAVNLALPMSALTQFGNSGRARAAERPLDGSTPVGTPTKLPSRVLTSSTTLNRSSSTAVMPSYTAPANHSQRALAAPAAAVLPGGPLILASASAPNQDQFNKGVQQYNAGQYEEALTTLQQVSADGLSDADKKTLSDTLAHAESASAQRKAARAEFQLGEKALADKQYNEAAKHYRNAASNGFADSGTRAKANEQYALAESTAKDAGVDPKSLYEKGKAAYDKGDWTAARQNLTAARDAGYQPGLFNESPQSLLDKVNAKAPAETAAAPTPAAPAKTLVVETPPAPTTPAPTAVTPAPTDNRVALQTEPTVTPAPAPTPAPEATTPPPPAPTPAPE
ncbi:MAG TPA: hypothetical protein VLI90_09100, partial [Tepidisphaeraceae bacterium]|nr:hypothetical protein [Tepidisphaeraceae bacterium]